MFELYVVCPTTGEPVYAGFHSDGSTRTMSRVFMDTSACPSCGAQHAWAAGVSLAIPVTAPPHDTASPQMTTRH